MCRFQLIKSMRLYINENIVVTSQLCGYVIVYKTPDIVKILYLN